MPTKVQPTNHVLDKLPPNNKRTLSENIPASRFQENQHYMQLQSNVFLRQQQLVDFYVAHPFSACRSKTDKILDLK